MFSPEFVTHKQPNLLDCHFQCFKCSGSHTITVNENSFRSWQNGAFVQNAFPQLSADDREMFISGICPTCWNEIYSEQKENDIINEEQTDPNDF